VASVARTLEAQSRSEGFAVRVYTIAYGSDPNRDALKQIAAASGGKDFAGDPNDIESVYKSISSFF
jgi:Ca-activated chloride channel family protein